jgi:hypothetical protein
MNMPEIPDQCDNGETVCFHRISQAGCHSCWNGEGDCPDRRPVAAPAQADPLPATPDVLRALYGLGGEGDGDGCVELTDGAVAAMGVPEDVVEYLREADARGAGGERDDDDDTEPDGAP